ncbi:MAG TPA: hypothetical protein VD970_12995 [Acetobacteraceae bacterium]|nr:hypothetical protein [Acetobacteraceae bacterium]
MPRCPIVLVAAGLLLASAAGATGTGVKEEDAPGFYFFGPEETAAARTQRLVEAFGAICGPIDDPVEIPRRAAAHGFVQATGPEVARLLGGEHGFLWIIRRTGGTEAILIYNARRRICLMGLAGEVDREEARRAFMAQAEAARAPGTGRATPEALNLAMYGEILRGTAVQTVPPGASRDRIARGMMLVVTGHERWDTRVVLGHGVLWETKGR